MEWLEELLSEVEERVHNIVEKESSQTMKKRVKTLLDE